MVEIEPYKFREKTNLQEHNDIVNKLNEVVSVINDTDMDNLNTRLTNDESQIAVNTTAIKNNTTDITALKADVSAMGTIVDRIEPMVDNHETDIANLKEAERRLSNDMPAIYTLYRNGEGKIKAQVETVGGTLIDSNTLDMIIPYQYDIISGTTNRSFKLAITMSDGSSYTTNDFVIPEGGGTDITVTGITLSKDSSNVNRFHVAINLSDSTMIDSGYITMIDNVSATFADSKLTISVNGVSSVPVAIDVSGDFTPGTGITITSGTIAIDSTVVALKSDISDMETKTNASATYATKTALASTDANVALAQSTADDANDKANNCFDNVSITDNVLTFTKTDDTHIDITLPSRPTVELPSITTSSTVVSETTETDYYYYNFSIIESQSIICVGDKNYSSPFTIKKIGFTRYGTKPSHFINTVVTTYLVNNSHNIIKDLPDGDYTIIYVFTSPNYSDLSRYLGADITVADGEVTSLTNTPCVNLKNAMMTTDTAHMIAILPRLENKPVVSII